MGQQNQLLNQPLSSYNRTYHKSQTWSKLEIASQAFPSLRESQIRLLISPKSLDLDPELSSVYQLPSVCLPLIRFPLYDCNMAPDRFIIPFPNSLLGPTCSDSHIPGYISHPK